MCPGAEAAEGWGLVSSYPTPLAGLQDCGSTPAPQSQTGGGAPALYCSWVGTS